MRKKRSHGEGTLYQLRTGKWRGLVTANGKRLSKTSEDKREVKAWLRKTISQVEAGLTYNSARVSAPDYLTQWLSGIKHTVRPTTYDHYELLITKHLIPQLGRILIKDLNADRIQFIYDELIKSGVGIPTVLKVHQVLHTALERAVKTGILYQNPAHYVSRPKETHREMKFWTESEANRFLLAARDNRLYCLFLLALTSGARQSELLGLQWQDLEWSRGILHIQRQLSRDGEMFSPLKTKNSKRSIELGPGSVVGLQEHYKNQVLERKIAGSSWQEHDLLFTTKNGAAMHQKNLLVNYYFPLIRAANVPAIRFHDMRHTAATIMLSHGIPPVIVAGMLGHSIPVLLNTYAHFIPTMQDQAAQLMDDILTPMAIDL
jgi:integrase